MILNERPLNVPGMERIRIDGTTQMLTSLPVNVSSSEFDGQKENNHGESDYQARDQEYEH